jgi:hypothetical protein
MVPMRGVFENLDATVKWDATTKKITALKGNRIVELTVDSKEALINNKKVILTIAPQIIKGRTMVPIRFVGESLEAEVIWIPKDYTVDIDSPNKTLDPELGKNNPTIESFIESYTKEQLKNLNNYKIINGKHFSQSLISAERKVRENNYAKEIQFQFTKDNYNYEVSSTFSKDIIGHQSHSIDIDKGNGVIVIAKGVRKQLDDFYIFITNFTEIDTKNDYIGKSLQDEILLLNPNDKKVYRVLSTYYRVNNDNDFSEPVNIQVETSIFNYDSNLEDNDFVNLFISSKNGESEITTLKIDRTKYFNDYGKFLNGFNSLPTYIAIDENRPYIYTYELLAQLSKPNWDYHIQTPFFRHSSPTNYSEEHQITNQQIEDLKYPFE